MKKNKLIIFCAIVILYLHSCKKENNIQVQAPAEFAKLKTINNSLKNGLLAYF
jgi:hypothetical protein